MKRNIKITEDTDGIVHVDLGCLELCFHNYDIFKTVTRSLARYCNNRDNPARGIPSMIAKAFISQQMSSEEGK